MEARKLICFLVEIMETAIKQSKAKTGTAVLCLIEKTCLASRLAAHNGMQTLGRMTKHQVATPIYSNRSKKAFQ